MDRDLEPSFIRRRRGRRIALGLAAGGALVALLLLLPGWLRPTVAASTLRTGVVDRGPVEEVVEATGTVVPAFEEVLSSPVEARVLRVLQPPGATVAAGQVLVALDLSQPRADLEVLEDRVARATSERERARVELADERERLERQRQSRALDAELAAAHLEQRRRLEAAGLVAEESVHELEVAARKADIEVAQATAEVASAVRTSAAKLRAVDLDLSILRREREETARRLELGAVRAPRPGSVTWVVQPEGVMVGRGDVVARLADLASFRVEAEVSDVHAAHLAAGLPARVLAAGREIGGTIDRVDPSVAQGRLRFTVALAEPSDPALRDKLRVDVLAVVGSKPRALRVERGAFAAPGGVTRVFVVQGDRLVRRRVRFGLQGHDRVEVLEGLTEGEEVVLSDLSDLDHLQEVELR